MNRTWRGRPKDFESEQMKKLRQASDTKPGQAYGMLSTALLELANNFTHTLNDLGVVMGIPLVFPCFEALSGTPSSSSRSLFLEPALLPPNSFQPLYMILPDCSNLTETQIEGLKRASCATQVMIGRPLQCITLKPHW